MAVERVMARCEEQYPGWLAEQLAAHAARIRAHVRARYHQTARVHGAAEAAHEATVGAATGMAAWRTAEAPAGCLWTYATNGIKFHFRRVVRGLSMGVTHPFCRKNGPGASAPLSERRIRVRVTSISDCEESVADRWRESDEWDVADRWRGADERDAAEEAAAAAGDIRRAARRVDRSGVAAYIVERLAAGDTGAEVAERIGVSRQRVHQVLDAIRAAVRGGGVRATSFAAEVVNKVRAETQLTEAV